jgi:hypothetical protein
MRQVEHNRKYSYVLAAFQKAYVADVWIGQRRELFQRQALLHS